MSTEPGSSKHTGRPRMLPVDMLLVFSDMRQYISLNELAELTGVHRVTLFKSLKRLPARDRANWLPGYRSGELTKKPMINDATLGTLHTLVKKGHSKQAIADRLGVNRSTIYRALGRPLPANAAAMALSA